MDEGEERRVVVDRSYEAEELRFRIVERPSGCQKSRLAISSYRVDEVIEKEASFAGAEVSSLIELGIWRTSDSEAIHDRSHRQLSAVVRL